MEKRESKYQPLLTRYVQSKRLSGVFELKESPTRSITKYCLEEQQKIYLEARGCAWKLSDMDVRKKPVDLMAVFDAESAVVVCMEKRFFFVDYPVWRDWPKKSFTFNDLTSCAYRIVVL